MTTTENAPAEIIGSYPGEENTEARVAAFADGFSASLWDLDVPHLGAVGTFFFRLDRFPDAEQRAHDKARELVGQAEEAKS